MRSALLHDRKGAANWILSKPAVRELMGTENVGKLNAYTEQVAGRPKDLQRLTIEEVARQGELEPMYTWYRQLSGDAAHPTLDALERYLVKSDTGSLEVQWGPDCDRDQLEWTVILSCNWLFAGLRAADEKLGLKLSATNFMALWARFLELSRSAG